MAVQLPIGMAVALEEVVIPLTVTSGEIVIGVPGATSTESR